MTTPTAKPVRSWLPELTLVLVVALPWVALLVLGMVWLWRGGKVWVWAITAAALGFLAWPLSQQQVFMPLLRICAAMVRQALITGDQKDTPLDEMLLQLGVCRGGFL